MNFVKPCETTKESLGPVIVSDGGFFCGGVHSDINSFFVLGDVRNEWPRAGILAKENPLISRFITSVLLPVVTVLRLAASSKIFFPAIKTVVVYVVNLLTILRSYYDAVKSHEFLRSMSPGDVGNRVPNIVSSPCTPFVFRNLIPILIIDYRKLALS